MVPLEEVPIGLAGIQDPPLLSRRQWKKQLVSSIFLLLFVIDIQIKAPKTVLDFPVTIPLLLDNHGKRPAKLSKVPGSAIDSNDGQKSSKVGEGDDKEEEELVALPSQNLDKLESDPMSLSQTQEILLAQLEIEKLQKQMLGNFIL